MNTTEIVENRNIEKGKLKQKCSLLTNDDQPLDQSKNEVQLGRMQLNLIKTKENIHKSQNPDLWFNEWIVVGGEKRRIEVCQSQAKNKKYDQLSVPYFLF